MDPGQETAPSTPTQIEDIGATLRGSRLFGELSREQAEHLARYVDRVHAEDGRTIVRQGESGEDLYVIASGQAEVRRRERSGTSRVLGSLYAGDYFGEIGLLQGGVRSADVVAMTNLVLYRLTRAGYLECLDTLTPDVHEELERAARGRNGPAEAAAPAHADEARAAFDRVLERLIEHEIESMRATEIRGERPTFDEMIEFYGSARFLYPEKMGVLRHRYEAVATTWQRLLGAQNDVFKILVLRRPVGKQLVAMNSICAFAYAPGTWQGQHLVSRSRGEYTGTLAALIGLVGGILEDPRIGFLRSTFRPNNPGVQALFGRVAEVLPKDTSNLAIRRYFVTPIPEPRAPGAASTLVRVEALRDDDSRCADFYGEKLHPVDLAALFLRDPRLDSVDARYRPYGLFRRREVLLATIDGRVVGAALCNVSSEGLNFSFLENAAEEIVVAADLPQDVRTSVLVALVDAIGTVYAREERDYLVWLVDDGVAGEIKGLLGAADVEEKGYGILTIGRERDSLLMATAFFTDYYRVLLAQQAAQTGGS